MPLTLDVQANSKIFPKRIPSCGPSLLIELLGIVVGGSPDAGIADLGEQFRVIARRIHFVAGSRNDSAAVQGACS